LYDPKQASVSVSSFVKVRLGGLPALENGLKCS
jgi:hypothetical protein